VKPFRTTSASLCFWRHICPLGRFGSAIWGLGGGFPGVPAAIAKPDCLVTLVESDIRKGVFLVTQRFDAVRGEFDLLISRAVNLFKRSGGSVCEGWISRVVFRGPARRGGHKAGKYKTNYRWGVRFAIHSDPVGTVERAVAWGRFHVKHSKMDVSRETSISCARVSF
jgi:hypothetical protein